jgi:hypothetical protein
VNLQTVKDTLANYKNLTVMHQPRVEDFPGMPHTFLICSEQKDTQGVYLHIITDGADQEVDVAYGHTYWDQDMCSQYESWSPADYQDGTAFWNHVWEGLAELNDNEES